MYKKNTQGWLKHIDFILWDLIALQVSFILAYKIRHGMKLTPYTVDTYRSLALVFIAIDLLVIVLFNTMHNVAKRGFLLEFFQSIKQAALVLLFMPWCH